jgi:hypothetical protein
MILKGALTSELTLLWLGLYPITMSDSILGSLSKRILRRAERVVLRVYCPRNKGCYKSHLSRTILSEMRLSIEVSDRKSMISFGW